MYPFVHAESFHLAFPLLKEALKQESEFKIQLTTFSRFVNQTIAFRLLELRSHFAIFFFF